MEGYDEKLNYKQIHLNWIKANPRFLPKLGLLDKTLYKSYYEEMLHRYNMSIRFNETAFMFLRDDYEFSKVKTNINSEVACMFGDVPENKNPTFFVTFNWSEGNFNKVKIFDGLQKLFRKSWVDNARGVFEFYGLKSNHPHFMCLIQVNKHKTIGRFRDKIFQSAIAQTLGKNFIDIKVAQSYHQDYLDLDKSPEKQECLEKDKIWRIDNGILSIYSKESI